MTTTAHEDQFTAEPEPVRQPYDTASILRRNVADLEIALKQQTERADQAEEKLTTARDDMQSWIDSRNGWMERAGAAEQELAKLRKQEPIKYLYRVTDCFGHDVLRDDPKGATILETIPLYASPVPAPDVPNEIGLGKGEFVLWQVKIGGVHGLAFVKTKDPKAVGTSHAEPEDGQIELGAGDSAIYFGNAESAMVLAERLQYVISLMTGSDAAPVPAVAAPTVPDNNWKRFTDDDLAEIHQLSYELGGTDSGEYLLDGDQLDQIVVKCASLFYAFPVKAAPAVPEEWRTDDPQLGEVIIVKRNEGLPFIGVFRTMPCRSCINRETGKWVEFSEWISLTTLLQSAEVTK